MNAPVTLINVPIPVLTLLEVMFVTVILDMH